jgi:hypothetical protein
MCALRCGRPHNLVSPLVRLRYATSVGKLASCSLLCRAVAAGCCTVLLLAPVLPPPAPLCGSLCRHQGKQHTLDTASLCWQTVCADLRQDHWSQSEQG